MAKSDLHLETLAIHAGQEPDPLTGAVMPPIHLSSTFAQQGPGVHKGFEYARTNNPTRQTLERCLAALEHASHGIAFSSGCGAMSTLLHTLSPGDHIVACDDLYGGTARILDRVMRPLGIETDFVDLTDAERLSTHLRPKTRFVWIETPTNPMLKLIDIRAIASIAHNANAMVIVDNTFATPMLQQPLLLGADVVIHSTTKYLNGHSDVVGGIIMTNHDDIAQNVRFLQNAMGAIPSPFDCFMVLRGVKTLPVRIERHSKTAMNLATWLKTRPEVERVIYPGLPDHPQHKLTTSQMSGTGGMVSFVIHGGLNSAQSFLSRVKIFTCAESLGGVESLIELPTMMTHGWLSPERRRELGITDGLIRISVGLEAEDDLKHDLHRAFATS